jgi:hypothetical protein
MQRRERFIVVSEELKKEKIILNGWVVDHKTTATTGEAYISNLYFISKWLHYMQKRIENKKISAVKINWNS